MTFKIDLRRATNTEIRLMLLNIRLPDMIVSSKTYITLRKSHHWLVFHSLMLIIHIFLCIVQAAAMAMDESRLDDFDQIENLINLFPTKEDMKFLLVTS